MSPDRAARQDAAIEAQRQFVAAASHELRASLTVVLGNLELLQHATTRAMPEEERMQAVHEAHADATRMARLVADPLLLARADAGVPLRRDSGELDRVLLRVIGDARHLTRGQRLAFADFEPVTVQGDEDRLEQLMLILVDNAIRYTAGGGCVHVSLRRTDGDVAIDMRDTGVGIEAADLPHVFERFYRADPPRSRNARWIAEKHSGSVELTSVPGSGTIARIRLPSGA